jgi:2-polyprenyl-6-methoxyphenol hydroxylase-like FAD-dependent oxidoreductase
MMKIIIIGAGISGLSAAIALKQTLPSIQIEVYEIRPSPSTIGGAVNLTPNALRYLSSLKVLPRLEKTACPVRNIEILSCRTGYKLADFGFDIPGSDGFQALRVKRSELLAGLTDTWLKDLGEEIIYDAKLSSIETASSGSVEAKFTVKGTPVTKTADLLLGCDGIHSFVRTSFVEPHRREIYSGIASAYGITSVSEEDKLNLSFDSSALFSSRRGSLLMSYTNPEKTSLFMAAVMETKEVSSREGWKVKGSDQEAVKNEILERFCRTGPWADKIKKVVDRLDDWFLFPVFKLPPGGLWSKDKILLLGDAAHAVRSLQ